MAQLKDLIVMGAARFIGDIYASSIQTNKINAPTASNGTTFGIGADGKVLKSNGTTIYWGDDNNTTYTLAGLVGAAKGSTSQPIYWTGSIFSPVTAIANTYLANSKITIAGNEISLGGSLAANTLVSSLGLSSALRFIGVTTTALEDNATTSSITIDGTTISSLKAGDVVFYNDKEFAWTGSKWEFLGGESSFKIVQTAKTDPTASGTGISYIATISQDANGVITATKSTVRNASATQSGVVTTGAQTFAGAKTFNGAIIALGNQSSAYNDYGIRFTNGSRIGENTSKDLGIYSAGSIYLRPGSATASSGDGIQINTTAVLPEGTTDDLGSSSVKWANVYATTFTGSLTGNAATATKASTVDITDTNATTGTYYYITQSTSRGAGQTLRATQRLYYYDYGSNTSGGWFNVGTTNYKGGLTLHDNSSYYGSIGVSSLTANRSYTLPNANGTIALTNSNITGNAATATKLQTARSISLGTAVTSTAQSFDGSANITIPVNSIKEAYLSWGGKNFSGSYGPIDAAMIPELGANRLAFMPAGSITVEYSNDGGSTWADYGTSTDNKINLFNGNGASLAIGKATSSSKATANSRLRITIATSAANVYTVLNKFCILVSTNGSSSCWCTIRGRLQSNYTSNVDTWTIFSEKVGLSGWPGYNIINTSSFTTYGNNASSHYGQIQFIFGADGSAASTSYSGLQIVKIFGFGGVGWTTPSTMAKTGHIYSWDSSKNTTFPAQVTATRFNGALNGNATTATTLQNARTFTIGNTGKTFNGSANVSWTTDEIGALNLTGGTVTGPTSFTTSVSIDDLTTGNLLVNGIATFNNIINGTIASANALTSNAGSGIQPIYFENGVPKAGTVVFDTLNANRLMWTSAANKPYAGYHYANSTKIAINSSSEPIENFYVNGNARFAIGSSDNTVNKKFIIGSSGNRYLSFGGGGVQAYNSDNTFGALYLQYNGGALAVGASNASVTGTLYGTYTFPTSKGFNYSGMGTGSDNTFRPVWFSYNGQTGTPVYDNDFKYNPSSNTLYILNLSTPSSTAMYVKPTSTLYLTTTSASSIIFTNNNVESARFNPSGSLRLGDTSADNTDKLYVNGRTTVTGNIKSGGNLILYNGLEVDRFLIFDYNNDSSAGASWRIGSLNSGSGDANYFTIQTGGSDTAATTWNNAIRIGMNTLDSAFGGNVYPSANNVKTLGTSSYKWADVYATTLHGALDGNAATATALSATIANNRLPVRLQEYHTSAMTLDSTICGWYYATSGGPFEIFHSSNKDYLVMNQGYSNVWGTQIATDFRSNRLAVRNKNNGTWSSWTKVLDQNTGITRAHYARTNSSAGYILIKITKLTNWMLSFTLRLYQGYDATDLLISGYNYETNYWYAPKAIILGSTDITAIEVKFGHTTTTYDLWLAVPAGAYTGADIFGACNGYTQIDLDGAFDISFVTELPESLQTTVTAYRPWYRNEILPIANGGTNANTAPGARANLGLGNAKIYYGTCATAAATAAKVVVCADYPSSPTIGDIVIVTFSNTNSAAVGSLTLNVNNSGAKSIKYMYNNAVNDIPAVGYLLAQTYIFHYDGTNWVIDNMHYNTNTTYSAMSVAEMKTGTATTLRTMRADYLKTFLSTLAGSGLSLTHNATNGVVLNHSNSITAGTVSDGGSTRTLAFGGTFKIPSVTYDAQGHITSTTTITLTMPAAPSSNTAGSTNKGNTKLFLIGAETQGANPQTYSNSNVYISTNNVLMGAAWNDYAEYRKAEIIEPGRCVVEKGNDELMISSQRLQRGAEIISDTFGFAIGETNECQTPIAVAGRVLAYGYEDRQEFKAHIGYPVCSGPNGTVSIMTEEEEKQYPSRIIGFISAVPEYQEWGSKKIKVNNRIWIRIK